MHGKITDVFQDFLLYKFRDILDVNRIWNVVAASFALNCNSCRQRVTCCCVGHSLDDLLQFYDLRLHIPEKDFQNAIQVKSYKNWTNKIIIGPYWSNSLQCIF